jgi:hypothetical protein
VSSFTDIAFWAEAGPALTAVRPDGYVGLCADTFDRAELEAWLSLIGARPPESPWTREDHRPQWSHPCA